MGTRLISLFLSVSLLELQKRQRGIYHLFNGSGTHIRTLVMDEITLAIPLSHFRTPRNVFEL